MCAAHLLLLVLGDTVGAVVDPDLHRVYPYLLLIAFGGIFALLGLRLLLIIKWRCVCEASALPS